MASLVLPNGWQLEHNEKSCVRLVRDFHSKGATGRFFIELRPTEDDPRITTILGAIAWGNYHLGGSYGIHPFGVFSNPVDLATLIEALDLPNDDEEASQPKSKGPLWYLNLSDKRPLEFWKLKSTLNERLIARNFYHCGWSKKQPPQSPGTPAYRVHLSRPGCEKFQTFWIGGNAIPTFPPPLIAVKEAGGINILGLQKMKLHQGRWDEDTFVDFRCT